MTTEENGSPSEHWLDDENLSSEEVNSRFVKLPTVAVVKPEREKSRANVDSLKD